MTCATNPRMTSAMETLMTVPNRRMTWRESARLLLALLMGVLVITGARAAAPAQRSFATPDDAVSALVQAVKAGDRNAMLAALGNVGEWLSSGDATADQAAAARFLVDYEQKHTIVRDGAKATLTIGNEDFPFAFPLVQSGEKWRFDTASGKE